MGVHIGDWFIVPLEFFRNPGSSFAGGWKFLCLFVFRGSCGNSAAAQSSWTLLKVAAENNMGLGCSKRGLLAHLVGCWKKLKLYGRHQGEL